MSSYASLCISYMPSNTASCTNLKFTEDTSKSQAEVKPLAHFNAKWRNNQLKVELLQLTNIFYGAGEAFTAPIQQSVNKHDDVFTKPGKPVAQNIKHKTNLLDPEKPVICHREQGISEIELQEKYKYMKKCIEKGWIQPTTSQYNHPSYYKQENWGTDSLHRLRRPHQHYYPWYISYTQHR